ncbi:MAG: hypothetical protein PHW04_06225 [Candidatus Wallbacteria bacterium]|nr:hypothetical protein [Candidatus Wallbacteria bacterium]
MGRLVILFLITAFSGIQAGNEAAKQLLKNWISLVESSDSLVLQFNLVSTNPLLRIERLTVPEICDPERQVYLKKLESDKNAAILKHNLDYLKPYEQIKDSIMTCGKPYRLQVDGNLDGKPEAELSPGIDECRRPLGASRNDYYIQKDSPLMPAFSRIEYRIDSDIAREVFKNSDLKIFRIIVKPLPDGNLEITLRRQFGHSDEGDVVIRTSFEWNPLP